MIESVRRLQLLCELARTGTVTAAAAATGCTSSAASQQLAVLEREAGAVLLERVGRGVRFTPAGRALVVHAEEVLAAVERAAAAVAAAAGRAGGRLRVAACADAARTLLAPATAAFTRAHPGVRLEVVECDPPEARLGVRRRAYDLAVVHDHAFAPAADDPGLTEAPLLDEPLVVAVPPDHAAAGQVRELSAFAGARWISGLPGSTCHGATVAACASAGFAPEFVHVTHDYDVQLALAASGVGVALVPLGVAAPSSAAVARLADPVLRRRTTTAVRRGAAGHPWITDLRAALAAQTGPVPARHAAGEPS